MALTALSAIIIAAEHQVLPSRDVLMQALFDTIRNATSIQDQTNKGKALMCAGNLAQACGKDNFPETALEEFTRFGIDCLQQTDSHFELKETAINYFSEISKIMRSRMAQILPIIIEPILESCETKVTSKDVEKPSTDTFDLDSESDDEYEMVGVDNGDLDEQTSAIHCVGNLALNCSGLMQPYLDRALEKLSKIGDYAHENVRYHVCLTYTQIAFGQLRLHLGKQDSDEKLEWTPGLPAQESLPAPVKTFVDTVLIPHFQGRMKQDYHKEVIEKVLECVRDMLDEMGPASVADHMEWIIQSVEMLLDKTAVCQTRKPEDMDGPEEGGDDGSEDSQEEDDEDLDHDELILGNATDVVISLSKCLKDSFLPYMQRLAPKLVLYLGDDHPKSDKIMVIGCLGETFNQCTPAIQAYFNDFFQVLLKHSTSDDSSLNRNVSYGISVLADKAPVESFAPHLGSAL